METIVSTDSHPDSYWDHLRLLARAASGDEESLGLVAVDPALCTLASQLAIESSLSMGARRVGLDQAGLGSPVVEAWHKQRRGVTAIWLMVSEATETVFPALAESCGLWAPIKGYQLGTEFYRTQEDRPIADLDVLIRMDDLPAACAALEKAGWRRRLTGDNIESYLAEEGYACQFFRQESAGRSVLVELHFRRILRMPGRRRRRRRRKELLPMFPRRQL